MKARGSQNELVLKKKMDGELSKDERSVDAQDIFINDVLNITLDKTISMINKRNSNAKDILNTSIFFTRSFVR